MGYSGRHAALSAPINKTDRNDALGIAQMMRVGLFKPVHVKTPASQLTGSAAAGQRPSFEVGGSLGVEFQPACPMADLFNHRQDHSVRASATSSETTTNRDGWPR